MAFKNLQKSFLYTFGASVALFSSLQTQAQCVPTFEYGCSYGDAIQGLSITGDESTAILETASGCAPGAYQPASGTPAITFTQGGTYSVTISTLFYEPDIDEGNMAAIWIDYNNNGEFESTELVGAYNSLIPTSGATFSITLPSDAVVGTYNMRIMVGYNFDEDFNPVTGEDYDPCNTSPVIEYGEVHDYTITVLESPLSVNLTDFSALRTADKVVSLAWNTHNERHNKGFHILRSNDGKNFESIGFVQTQAEQGNSNQSVAYQFVDVDAPQNTLYYQLEQIDEDGRTLRSQVVSVQPISVVASVSIYPNPATDLVHIKAPKNFGSNATISLIDLNGRTLSQEKLSSELTSIDISQLPAGVYLIQYTDAGNNHTLKLTKN